MYPNLYYLLKELFGLDLPFLKAISSAGFFMALAFIPGGWLWSYELKRKEKNGELRPVTQTIFIGKGLNVGRIILHFVLGFIAGFKLVGLVTLYASIQNNAYYLFSLNGNLAAGFICAIVWSAITFYKNYKQRSSQTQQETVQIYPHEYVLRGVVVAAISGVVGAKVFGVFENWNAFIKDPISTFFSSEGFAYLGGFIVATFAMWFYHYKFGTQRMLMADALAPSLMLSYSLGRLGCQIAGDGDWGINNAYQKPAWLPQWLWSYDYPHNILHKGIYMQGCTWDDYCNKLAVGVYPTPLYELIIGLILFAVLMLIRKRIKLAGRISAFYLMFAATERFFIEKIRVDIRYNFFGFHPTQAELLSVFCFCCGIILYFIAPKLNANKPILQQQ